MTGQGLVLHSMAAFLSMVIDGFGLVPGLESVTDSTPP